MTTHAINSGAINAVPFPGAEVGLSAVELTGTVRVVCSVGPITLQLTAPATTTASAVAGTITTKSRIQIGATTQCTAMTADIEPRVLVHVQAVQPAEAIVACAAFNKLQVAATTQGTGAGSVDSLIRTGLFANATASAVTAVSGRTLAHVSGSISALASTTTDSVIKAFKAASTTGVATTAASLTISSRLSATTTAAAACADIGTSRKWVVTPSTVASAIVGDITLGMKIATGLVSVATASTGEPVALIKRGTGADTTAQAITSSPLTGRKLQTQASVVATAITYTAASDYGVTIPAPSERQMVVPEYERRMKAA